jgi:hypothetical protein
MSREGKLTKAQTRWLRALGELHRDACFTLECIDRGYNEMPLFRARLRSVPCPTCGHPTKEQVVKWEVVDALNQAGMISERLRGTGYYYINPVGLAALESQKP